MLRRTRLENFTGTTGLAGVISGLLTMTMMIGLILALAITSEANLQPSNTASAPTASGSSATGASTGEAGQE